MMHTYAIITQTYLNKDMEAAYKQDATVSLKDQSR